MPFKSEKQRSYMWAQEPEIASRWTREYGARPQAKKKKKFTDIAKSMKSY
jgi:hypothetical protein